jgi:hypothetical protein
MFEYAALDTESGYGEELRNPVAGTSGPVDEGEVQFVSVVLALGLDGRFASYPTPPDRHRDAPHHHRQDTQ